MRGANDCKEVKVGGRLEAVFIETTCRLGAIQDDSSGGRLRGEDTCEGLVASNIARGVGRGVATDQRNLLGKASG